jgi:hypothetical protein
VLSTRQTETIAEYQEKHVIENRLTRTFPNLNSIIDSHFNSLPVQLDLITLWKIFGIKIG